MENGINCDKPAVTLFCPACSHVIKEPRVLPCLHSICTSCIDKQLNGDYRCPACDELVNGIHSSEDVTRLPVDSLLESVLDMVALHGGKNVHCDVCDDSERSSAVSRCMECFLYLCSIHCDAHKIAKHSKGHPLIPVNQLRQHPLKELRRPLYCMDHPDDFLSSFCETRDRPVCKHCCASVKDHHHFTLDQAIQKYNHQIHSLLQKALHMSQSMEETLSDIDLVVTNINTKVKNLLYEMDVIFDYQINSILKRKKDLRNQILEIRKSKTQTLRKQQDSLKSLQGKLNHACKFADITVTTSLHHSNASSLVLKHFLTSRLWYFLDRESLFLQPEEDSSLDLHFDDSLLHQAIQNFGGLETRFVCSQKCTARGAGVKTAFIGETAKFLVYIMDQREEILFNSKELVTVDILTSEGIRVDVDHIISRNDGTYEVSYRPLLQRPLTITVKVREQEIRGSPFKVAVCNQIRKSWI